MAIKSWSTTAGDNDNADASINWEENQAPSTVNGSARAMMAAVRSWYDDLEWRDWGHTVAYASASTFTIAGDVTAIYVANRPIRCTDATTLYGIVASSSYGAPNTTVTVTLDSGSLSASLTAVSVGFTTSTQPINISSVRAGANDTITGNDTLVAGDFSDFPVISTITATATVALPAASGVTSGKGRIFVSTTTGDVQLDPDGTDTIGGTNANFRVPSHEVVEIRSNGSNGWIITRRPNDHIGKIVMQGMSSVPNGLGYVACDGSAISRTTYAGLFGVISTTFGTGDGSTTFNVPNLAGRVPVGSGTGTLTEDVTDANVSTGDDTFTVASNSTKWVTGMSCVLTTTTTLPTGLSLATTYYVIRASATTIKFASSLANAQNGTAIDITAVAGSGTHTITHTLTARTLGEKLGEESHAMSSAELLAHTHQNALDVNNGRAAAGTAVWSADVATYETTSTGGNAAMNIMQPSIVLNYIIKT